MSSDDDDSPGVRVFYFDKSGFHWDKTGLTIASWFAACIWVISAFYLFSRLKIFSGLVMLSALVFLVPPIYWRVFPKLPFERLIRVAAAVFLWFLAVIIAAILKI